MTMDLQARWKDLAEALGILKRADEIWQVMYTAYGEPHRHYHNLTHIRAVIRNADHLRGQFENPDVAALALFFHDIIYDAARSDNEDRSADLLRDTLPEIDTTAAESMIRATKSHRQTDDADTNLLLDIDMAILGTGWPDYLAYAQGVYREYLPVYGHDAYAAGRVATFLEPTLTHDRLFLTPDFAGRETQARDNLHREIALWREGGFAALLDGSITPHT